MKTKRRRLMPRRIGRLRVSSGRCGITMKTWARPWTNVRRALVRVKKPPVTEGQGRAGCSGNAEERLHHRHSRTGHSADHQQLGRRLRAAHRLRARPKASARPCRERYRTAEGYPLGTVGVNPNSSKYKKGPVCPPIASGASKVARRAGCGMS